MEIKGKYGREKKLIKYLKVVAPDEILTHLSAKLLKILFD